MKHDVIIIGGGVSGTALLYTLSKYTNVKNIGLIEKYSEFGLVNSSPTMNSQILHFGDIETNYTFEKAKKVKLYADMVMHYLEHEKVVKGDEGLFIKVPKMVLAVGKDQVKTLQDRYPSFSQLFPKLKMIGREEIGKIEPRILEGRDPDQELLALVTEDGYTVDFRKLCDSFANNATKKLELGEAKILGEKIIFNITPSPGASTCLGNAFEDTSRLMEFLSKRFTFDYDQFEKDLVFVLAECK